MINVTNNLDIFNPDLFKENIHIIGAGAVGSKVALELAKLGIEDIYVYDFDVVERHNISNQVFGISDIGKFKVDALQERIEEMTGIKIKAINKKVESDELNGIVFLLPDTMSSRTDIWNNSCKYKVGVKYLIETRMDVDLLRIYSLFPTNIDQVKQYEKTLYKSEEVKVESACGANPSIGSTSSIIAGMAVWQFMKWYRKYVLFIEDQDAPEFMVLFSFNPFCLITKKSENI